MSDLVATVWTDYISQYQKGLDKSNDRPSIYGGMNLHRAQNAQPQSIWTPQVRENIKKSFNVDVQIPVLDTQNITVSNARACTFQTEGADSALVTVVMATYTAGFRATPMNHMENYVAYSAQINALIEARLIQLAQAIDQAAVNSVEAGINQFWPAGITAFYPQVGNVLQVPQADKNEFYNRLQDLMSTADYAGPYDILTNHVGMTNPRRLSAQGEGNAVNEGFQLLGYNWYPTNRVVNANPGTEESTLYAIPQGMVAMESRIAPSARINDRVHEGKFWDVLPNAPFVNMDLDVFYQADCQDASAENTGSAGTARNTAVKRESWQIGVDVGFGFAYVTNPVTEHRPIFKATILQ